MGGEFESQRDSYKKTSDSTDPSLTHKIYFTIIMANILFSGGAGYVGSVLTPKLIRSGHKVVIYDNFYFGNFLPFREPNLEFISADIRNIKSWEQAINLHKIDTVIDFACISNDASFALNENLSTDVNLNAFAPRVEAAIRQKVQKFIFASSSSVYGVSLKDKVIESDPFVPLTLYNRYKGDCEKILFELAKSKMVATAIRPATVCGVSPRMRFDLSVNIFANNTFSKNEIEIFGGDQTRPNIHIEDLSNFYVNLLNAPTVLIDGESFNVGTENLTIRQIAGMSTEVYTELYPNREIKIKTIHSDDKRSYRINSDKAKNQLGFDPKFTVRDAIRDIYNAFQSGYFSDRDYSTAYQNVKHLLKLRIK
jgi:nucleoside-diphosphate-sugar epimerase